MSAQLYRFSIPRDEHDLTNQLNRLRDNLQQIIDDVQSKLVTVKTVAPAPAAQPTVLPGGISITGGAGSTVVEAGNAGISVAQDGNTYLVSAVGSATQLLTPLVKTIADSPFTIPAGNVFLDASASAGADFTANLPAATGSGFIVVVKKTDANAHNVVVNPNGTNTIDGVNNATKSTISLQFATFALIDVASGKWDLWG